MANMIESGPGQFVHHNTVLLYLSTEDQYKSGVQISVTMHNCSYCPRHHNSCSIVSDSLVTTHTHTNIHTTQRCMLMRRSRRTQTWAIAGSTGSISGHPCSARYHVLPLERYVIFLYTSEMHRIVVCRFNSLNSGPANNSDLKG